MNPASKLAEIMNDYSTVHIYEGVKIVHHGSNEKVGPFVNRILKAMAIVKANDQRRYRRVLRLKYIVEGFGTSDKALAYYDYRLRQCVVDLEKIDSLDDGKVWQTPECMAMILVHEATHCLLSDRLGEMQREPEFNLRIEAICYREQARFMRKIGWEMSEEFDEESYRRGWNLSKVERVIEGCELISERLEESKTRTVIRGIGRVFRAFKETQSKLS